MKSKGAEISHNYLGMKKYLAPKKYKIRIKEAQTIFSIRSRMVQVKIIFCQKYKNFKCRVCGIENETQEHALNGKELVVTKYDLKYDAIFKIMLQK